MIIKKMFQLHLFFGAVYCCDATACDLVDMCVLFLPISIGECEKAAYAIHYDGAGTKKSAEKSEKKVPATFSIRFSSSLRTKCIQRPKGTHPIVQTERVKENERRGEMIECVHID